MRKLFLSLCMVCTTIAVCILIACEKPIIQDDSVASGSLADANLIVTVYEIEKTPFEYFTRGTSGSAARAAKPASEACTRLNFAIYDEGGSRLKQVNQTKAEADFGKASFQLEPGDYTLVVVGHSSNGNPTMTNLGKIQFTNTQGYTETFLYHATVTIGEDPVEKQASLDRIVSMCRFVLTDDIPSVLCSLSYLCTQH